MNQKKKGLSADLPKNLQSADALNVQIAQNDANVVMLEKRITQAQNAKHEHDNALSVSTNYVDNCKRRLKAMQDQLANHQAAWQKKLDQSVFDNLEEFLSARLDPEQADALQQHINQHEQQLTVASTRHEDLRKKLASLDRPNLDRLKAKLARSSDRYAKAEADWLVANRRLHALKDTRKQLKSALKAQNKLEEEYRVVGTLSDIANGSRGMRLSFQRYVLGVLLDEVLVSATARLNTMSNGRYILLRKQAQVQGNRHVGLDLDVEDAYTGSIRPVSTLSGGESFMAALSLALGLADTVQNHAGGVHLDTLFIDEGFGSLDAESLELAIRSLVDLKNSGRSVGIISHVSELKAQITCQIKVSAGKQGSVTKLMGRASAQ